MQEAPRMKLHHFGLFLIFALCILIAAIGSGILLYRTAHEQSSRSPKTLSQMLTADLTPEVTFIPANPLSKTASSSNPSTTASWRSYKNPAYQFSLSYPANLQLKQTTQPLGITSVELRSGDNLDPNNTPDYQLLIFPKTIGNLIGQNFAAYYAMPADTTQIMKGTNGSSEQFTKQSNRIVDNLPAFDYQTTSSPPDPNQEAEIGNYIEIGNNIFIISTSTDDKTTLEQILKTFTYPS